MEINHGRCTWRVYPLSCVMDRCFHSFAELFCSFLACPCRCHLTLAIPTSAFFHPNCFILYTFFSSSKHILTSSTLHRVPNINTNIAFCRCPLARLHTLLNRMRTALDPSQYAIHTLPICGSCHSDASQGFPAAASRHWAGLCTRHLEGTYPPLIYGWALFVLRQSIFPLPLPASAFAMTCFRLFSRPPHGRRAACLDQLTLTASYQTSAARCAASVTRYFCLFVFLANCCHLCHTDAALETPIPPQKACML